MSFKIREGKTDNLKGGVEKVAIIAGNFNMPLSVRGRTSRQQNTKYIEDFSSTINQLDLIDTSRAVHTQQQNPHYFQGHMKHLSRQTMLWAIKQFTIHFK